MHHGSDNMFRINSKKVCVSKLMCTVTVSITDTDVDQANLSVMSSAFVCRSMCSP